MSKAKPESTQYEYIVCDLEWPRIINELRELDDRELKQVESTVEKLKKMTWDQLYKTSSKTQKRGLNWESIDGQKTRSGKVIASIRVSGMFRARACRDGKYMRFISLDADPDSAYFEFGDEVV